MARSYDQYCPVAAALDVVGDRWTLLIMRELVAGDRRFTDLKDRLPGIAPNLLSDRLRDLQAEGLVEHKELPPPAARTVYAATTLGRELVPVLRSLARFGVSRLGPPEGTTSNRRSRCTAWSPRTTSRNRPAERFHARLEVDGRTFDVLTDGDRMSLRRRPDDVPDVVIEVSARRSRRRPPGHPRGAGDGRPRRSPLRPAVPTDLTALRPARPASRPGRPSRASLPRLVEHAEPRLELADRQLLGLIPAGDLVGGRLRRVVPPERLAVVGALDVVGDARSQPGGDDAEEVGAAAGLAQHGAQVDGAGRRVVGQRLGVDAGVQGQAGGIDGVVDLLGGGAEGVEALDGGELRPGRSAWQHDR